MGRDRLRDGGLHLGPHQVAAERGSTTATAEARAVGERRVSSIVDMSSEVDTLQGEYSIVTDYSERLCPHVFPAFPALVTEHYRCTSSGLSVATVVNTLGASTDVSKGGL